MSAVSLGIDIGGTKMLGVAVDEEGEVVARSLRATTRGEDGVLAGIGHVVGDLRRDLGDAEVASLGIGIPGIVDSGTGRVRHSVNLDLGEVDLGARVARMLRLSTAVDNDVVLAAVGEAQRRPEVRSLALLSLGTGLAVGLVEEGAAVRGAFGVAGEIGHLPVEANGPRCGCGQRGCLELYISGSGIARMWPVQEGPAARDLAARASAGDPEALATFGLVLDHLAWAIQLIALSTDPARILIGGGLAGLGGLLFGPLGDRLLKAEESSPFLASLGLARRVEPGTGPETAAIGAAWHGRRAHAVSVPAVSAHP